MSPAPSQDWSRFQRRMRRRWLLALMLVLPGCALLQLSQKVSAPGAQDTADKVRSALLPPIPTPQHAIELEFVFVERPVGDPLLGDRLWNEIDQAAAIDPKVRKTLQNNGMQVGVAAANPPQALQALLGLQPGLPNGSNKMAGHRLALPSGAESEIQASHVYPACTVTLLDQEGAQQKEYENARFLFRVMARRVQNGWVQVDFLPEIHHGQQAMRPTAGEAGWNLRSAQKIEPLFGQRFSVNLNLGEMAVLTCGGEEPQSVGRHFFVREHEGKSLQRLLVVRLADMVKAPPVYAQK